MQEFTFFSNLIKSQLIRSQLPRVYAGEGHPLFLTPGSHRSAETTGILKMKMKMKMKKEAE